METATLLSLLFLAEAVILAAYWQEIARFADRAHAAQSAEDRRKWLICANHYDGWFRRIAAVGGATVLMLLLSLFGPPAGEHGVRWAAGLLWLVVLGFCVKYVCGWYLTDYRDKDLQRLDELAGASEQEAVRQERSTERRIGE